MHHTFMWTDLIDLTDGKCDTCTVCAFGPPSKPGPSSPPGGNGLLANHCHCWHLPCGGAEREWSQASHPHFERRWTQQKEKMRLDRALGAYFQSKGLFSIGFQTIPPTQGHGPPVSMASKQRCQRCQVGQGKKQLGCQDHQEKGRTGTEGPASTATLTTPASRGSQQT